jgi:hypothetical protein
MANDQPERGGPPVVAWVLWGVVRTVMWGWAITCPLLIVAGAASYFVDMSSFLPIPGPEALRFGIPLGTVGLAFVWLRLRGFIRFTGEIRRE